MAAGQAGLLVCSFAATCFFFLLHLYADTTKEKKKKS
jgi:hypothetical protein